MKIKFLYFLLALCLIALAITITWGIVNFNEVEQRCKEKGWDGVGIEDGAYTCYNYPQGRLDAIQEKSE